MPGTLKIAETVAEATMLGRWLELMDRVSSRPRGAESRAVFDDLVARYTARDRRYHDLSHIEACLQLLDAAKELAHHADSIELAIWFHDAVYDTRRGDNEQMSAQLAGDTLRRLGVQPATIESVTDLILATRHEFPPPSPDTALLVDIDLAILGGPPAVFDAYEAGVRLEYSWVPETDFREARARVLKSFVDRPHIYGTKFFAAAFELAARENLGRLLANLAG